jgi:protein-tyrosine-phosphatase
MANRLIDEIAKRIRMNEPVTIGCVCTANKHRSAAAELVFRQRLKEEKLDRVKVRSAGLRTVRAGIDERPLRVANPELCRTAPAQGIDPDICESFTARQVRGEFVEEADLILAAGPSHKEFLEYHFPQSKGKVVLFTDFVPSHPVFQRFGAEFPDPQSGRVSVLQLLRLIDQTVVRPLLGLAAESWG